MSKKSAGILFYRVESSGLEFLLVHPGGPFWAKKDDGAWSIPKGELGPEEKGLAAAIREAKEELGVKVDGPIIELTAIRQAGGKLVQAWAVEQDIDTTQITSNQFEMEWPPRSGKMKSFPEVDRAAWFLPGVARTKILAAQVPLLDELASIVNR